jgi:hypothetical protein
MTALPCSRGTTHGKQKAHGKDTARHSAKHTRTVKQPDGARQSNPPRQRGHEGARQSRGHGNDAFAVRGNPLPCVFARHRGQFHFFSFFCSIHIYINTYICCKISFYFL